MKASTVVQLEGGHFSACVCVTAKGCRVAVVGKEEATWSWLLWGYMWQEGTPPPARFRVATWRWDVFPKGSRSMGPAENAV